MNESLSTTELIRRIQKATPNPVTPEQAAEAFALGSKTTDVQREMIEKNLVGSIVEWDLRVYEVAHDKGGFKVTSQPIPIQDDDAMPLLRVAALIQPQDAADDDRLRTIKTDEAIRIRGLVRDVVLRTVVTIGPAVVVR